MEDGTEPLRRCGSCGVLRPLDEFYLELEKRRSAKIGRRFLASCRPCSRRKMLARIEEQRQYINNIKLERGCADCGLKSDVPEVYDFDHLPQYEKVDHIARMRIGSLDALKAEIAKCDVVCANCHRMRTVQRQDNSRARNWDLRRQQPQPDPPGQPTLFDTA